MIEMTRTVLHSSLYTAAVQPAVLTNADYESPITRDYGREDTAHDSWDLIDKKLIEWGCDPSQLDEEGTIIPSGDTIQLAIQIAKELDGPGISLLRRESFPMPTEGLCLNFKATLSLSQSISNRTGALSIAFSRIIASYCRKLFAANWQGITALSVCRYCRVIERIGDEEILYRRIPVSMGWYDSNGLSPESFKNTPPRHTDPGFLLPAREYKSLEAAAQGKSKNGYYVVVFRAADLRAQNIQSFRGHYRMTQVMPNCPT